MTSSIVIATVIDFDFDFDFDLDLDIDHEQVPRRRATPRVHPHRHCARL